MSAKGKAPSAGALPDLVYVVRAGENEELRHSLRSVAQNAEGLFRKVWVVGSGLPEWLTGVNVIEAGSDEGRVEDVKAKVLAAVKHQGVGAKFVLMHDDFFLTEKITEWNIWHMGTVRDYLAMLATNGVTPENNPPARAMRQTAVWVKRQLGETPLCYQGHRPALFSKSKLRKAIEAFPADRILDVVGLYPIAGEAGVGEQGENAKVGSSDEEFHAKVGKLSTPWLSSNDQGFADGLIGEHIRGLFPEPSIFEK